LEKRLAYILVLNLRHIQNTKNNKQKVTKNEVKTLTLLAWALLIYLVTR